jgi:hypothetical protein
MSEATSPTPEQENALVALGVNKEQISALLSGRAVVYSLPTEGDPGIAIVQIIGSRLRSGVVAIKDPGGGLKTLARFRGRSNSVARLLSLTELELFGAAYQ